MEAYVKTGHGTMSEAWQPSGKGPCLHCGGSGRQRSHAAGTAYGPQQLQGMGALRDDGSKAGPKQ